MEKVNDQVVHPEFNILPQLSSEESIILDTVIKPSYILVPDCELELQQCDICVFQKN